MDGKIGCFVLLVLLYTDLVCAICPKGRYRYTFGTDCRLQCRCDDDNEVCDEVTGSCISGCQRGWTGPGCQYEDLALYATVDGGPVLYDTDRVTNGKRWECTKQNDDIDDPYVTIILDRTYDITDLMLFFKTNANSNISGVEVYVGDSADRNLFTLCHRRAGADDTTTTQIQVTCSRLMSGRYITVLLAGPDRVLNLCEVEILGGRALEFGRYANHSSTETGNDWAPENAVDGGTDKWSHTKEEANPWWYVDLGGLRMVTKIIILNRLGGIGDRLLNFKVYLSEHNGFADKRLIHSDTNSPVADQTDIDITATLARYVRVELEGERRFLTLRQVLVFGSCPRGTCGLQCGVECHCKDTYRPVLRELNATCTEPCERGWTGPPGFCSLSSCPSNRFGYGCYYRCHCDGSCDPWTGQCLNGATCQDIYTGKTCQAYNSLYRSLITAEGNTTYSAAPATVDGDIDTCGAVLVGRTATWTSPFPTPRPVDQIIVHLNAISTLFDVEIMTENDVSSMRCDVTDLAATGSLVVRCYNFNATNIRLRTRSIMQICEVQVLECSEGTFGDRCERMCHCQDHVPCNTTTGECPSDLCLPGYTGSRCDQPCRPGYYGENCTAVCGSCKDGGLCDHITGQCETGCAAGWRGPTCKDECRNGTFGEACTEYCGLCMDGEPCNKVYGTCPKGCQAGYYGDQCLTDCEPGRYGINCNATCGTCAQSAPCDRRTGQCSTGCQAGLLPPFCQDKCGFGRYGVSCLYSCGSCQNNETCDVVTGVCTNGCGPGVVVDSLCNKVCPNGFYGYNCAETCVVDVCKDTDICDKATGGCTIGCKEIGKRAPFCLTDCYEGTFGQDCNSTCGACLDGEACNQITGVCPNGCTAGFQGLDCRSYTLAVSADGSPVSNVAVLVVGVILACLGIVAFIVAIVICTKRRATKPDDSERPDKPDRPVKPERPEKQKSTVYENNISLETEAGNLTSLPAAKRNSQGGGYYRRPSDTRTTHRGSISVPDLWEFVLERKSKKIELFQQFKELNNGLGHPCEAAKKAQNAKKNRYKEVFAYDHSRVKLTPVPGDAGNDYINANFISGYNRPHSYIAAQGPTEELVNDFWRMVWQKKVRKIVMLTRLVEQGNVKCAQYWPDEGGQQFGAVHVVLINTEPYADYDVRTLKITADGKERREIKQLHYTAWPDRDVPEYSSSLVQFWGRVRNTDPKDNVPSIVHCSAGLGRTGTFLALDYLVDQANVEGFVNIFQCVQNLRHQRVNMVQTQDQYVFLHEALLEALICPSHSTPCEKFPLVYRKLQEIDPKNRKSKLEAEFEKLQRVTKFHESQRLDFYLRSEYNSARREDNRDKNRSNIILPAEAHRPKLMTRVFDRTDYINAVYLPSYREDKVFLLTQNPLPDTTVDFWRLAYEHDVTTIVSLEQSKVKNETYWPVAGETMTFVPFQLHHVTEEDHITYIERTVKLLNAEEPHERPRTVKLFEVRFWEAGKAVPDEPGSMLALQEQVQKWQRQTGNQPLLVHCMNGADRSGLYCVLSSVIERLKIERDVAISQTMKQMRVRRHQIVPNLAQYKFCHEAVTEFLRGFDTYSNFFI